MRSLKKSVQQVLRKKVDVKNATPDVAESGATRRIAPRGRLERINPAVHYEQSDCPLEQVCDRCWPPWADPRDSEGRDFCSGGAVWVSTLGRARRSGSGRRLGADLMIPQLSATVSSAAGRSSRK